MKLQINGCSHHQASVALRERIAFSPDQTRAALRAIRERFPGSEAVLLSTCNRVELYLASDQPHSCPSRHDVISFFSEFHGVDASELFDDLYERTGEDFVRHLFTVAASLDSMVVGESQILSQVKQAYDVAVRENSAGPLTNAAFQAALRVAKRVATETGIQQHRVSIPSVAVADVAKEFFERFDDKQVLVIGAGEMGEETVRYLRDEGARAITIVNRNLERARELAEKLEAQVAPWENLDDLAANADLIVSATGAVQPIMEMARFKAIHTARDQRNLLILDLAVPRDFEPAIGDLIGVYLCSVDDLKEACERNRNEREREWPKAEKIIEAETERFMRDLNHRATGPTIKRLKERAQDIKSQELERLFNKLGPIDASIREEIEHSYERFKNKLLHPPLESLREEARDGAPYGLIDALKRLFRLSD